MHNVHESKGICSPKFREVYCGIIVRNNVEVNAALKTIVVQINTHLQRSWLSTIHEL